MVPMDYFHFNEGKSQTIVQDLISNKLNYFILQKFTSEFKSIKPLIQ